MEEDGEEKRGLRESFGSTEIKVTFVTSYNFQPSTPGPTVF